MENLHKLFYILKLSFLYCSSELKQYFMLVYNLFKYHVLVIYRRHCYCTLQVDVDITNFCNFPTKVKYS